LSGGNLQRVILARELSSKPRLLIAAYPTRGLDVAATELVHQLFLQAREQGSAILLISEELWELCALSDRIGVIRRGQLVAERAAREATLPELGLLMATGADPATQSPKEPAHAAHPV
jgi:simple sugar transport system ATP-binding protein